MMKLTLVSLLVATSVSGFSPIAQTARRSNGHTELRESFGLGIGEDTYENQPDLLRGEQEYKQFVNKYAENNMLNRKYNVIGRVRELNLLKATADSGILSKLEASGVDLETIESLLPIAEDLGLLSLAGSNQQLLVNLAAPLLIEPAPYLIPVVAGAVATGPAAFYGAAAGCVGLEYILIASNAEIPFVGLPASVLVGLLLVPLSLVLTAAGTALASVKK